MSTDQDSLKVLLACRPSQWEVYDPLLQNALADEGLKANILREAEDPGAIDYIVYSPASGLVDFAPFTELKAVLSLWAGVEQIVGNETIRVPLCRMVDPGLTEGMVEWVTGHVLRHHLGMDRHIHGQDGIWRDDTVPPLARDRKVAIIGLGALGMACAETLSTLNFDVSGWSRTAKSSASVTCLSGEAELDQLLSSAEILVLLLPLTGETDGFLNANRLASLPEGAVIINPGRGGLIDDDALLAALDDGRIAHATLDVFREEPLPKDHRYWSHAHVTVTPHIASCTRAATAAQTAARNIRRGEDGLPFLHQVDRALGY